MLKINNISYLFLTRVATSQLRRGHGVLQQCIERLRHVAAAARSSASHAAPGDGRAAAMEKMRWDTTRDTNWELVNQRG